MGSQTSRLHRCPGIRAPLRPYKPIPSAALLAALNLPVWGGVGWGGVVGRGVKRVVFAHGFLLSLTWAIADLLGLSWLYCQLCTGSGRLRAGGTGQHLTSRPRCAFLPRLRGSHPDRALRSAPQPWSAGDSTPCGVNPCPVRAGSRWAQFVHFPGRSPTDPAVLPTHGQPTQEHRLPLAPPPSALPSPPPP